MDVDYDIQRLDGYQRKFGVFLFCNGARTGRTSGKYGNRRSDGVPSVLQRDSAADLADGHDDAFVARQRGVYVDDAFALIDGRNGLPCNLVGADHYDERSER